MFKALYYKTDGKKGKARALPDSLFDGVVNEAVLHQVVKAYLANQRQGTHAGKNRSAVAGGSRKPWRQKGTGRARAGSNRSPIWVGGGVVFGPRPQDFSKKMNKKVKQLAFRRALFDRIQSGELAVIESFEVNPVKTRTMNALIGRIAPKGTVLLVDDSFSDDAVRAGRNITRIDFAESAHLNATELCLFDHLIVTERGLQSLLARMNGGAS